MSARWPKRKTTSDPSCPSGAEWHSCETGGFVGCCTSNPCSKGCPDADLRAAGPSITQIDDLPDVICGKDSKFYTCTRGTKTFWGCCASDPCTDSPRCPRNDLRPAKVKGRAQSSDSTSFSTSLPTSQTKTSNSDITTSTGQSDTATTTSSWDTASTIPSTSSSAAAVASSSPHRNYAIIGGAAAGGFCVALLIGVIIFFWLHVRKSRRHHQLDFNRRQSGTSENDIMVEKTISQASTLRHAPSSQPSYTDFPSPITSSFPSTSPSYKYRHYSAESFSIPIPEPAPDLPTVWQASHKPPPLPLHAEPIGTFELDSPISPMSYDHLRKSTDSGRLKAAAPCRHTMVILPPPLPPPERALGTWQTSRKSIG